MLELKKRINSFKYAFEGIIMTIRSETNMKIHLFVMILVIVAGVVLKLSAVQWKIGIILFSFVIAGELFNTAIETAVDIAMPEKDSRAKKAKDVSASAVLVLAIASAIIGLMIFIPKLY